MTRERTRHSKAWYNALSRYYDVFIDPFQGRLRRRGIEHLSTSSDDSVLDVGCGTGRGVARLQTAVGFDGQVVGIDVAEQMCRLTQDRLDDGGPSTVVCGDALALPFDTDSFDGVLVSFTLELFEDDHRTTILEEIRRVLNPQGRICVISPSKAAGTIVSPLYTRLNEVLPTLVDSRPLDVSAVLADASFEIVRTQMERVLVVPVELVVARRGSRT
ncbi:class I SAM-dependent methyltransferase [Natrinema salaciae]|uniref:Demethylmenaquinone methyltransferase / 2-methoxy-6-polyprenyl-1,4-benzoquinol methylase n=1 Tax=Natrinema salaciae TaxID=1186196 RepID=A0A1H9K619_9EURY|nr:methyltransferase domain-containing protein [Natrinema salaciae]SEQ94594.1 demethylmenaquinone methyltransferase / 2-methoxy-6-polyprenyl-1,4-benzoquinol methylase [Natrinema salaciae]